MRSVHIVCVGNICRSPLLEEILRSKAKEQALFDLEFSSSGIVDDHIGCSADPRMIKAAALRGYSLDHHQARRFEMEFFQQYDLILGVTREILEGLLLSRELCDGKSKLLLATTFSKNYCDLDIPDPYYGGEQGFDQVIDLCEDAALGLLVWLGRKEKPLYQKDQQET